MSTQDKFAYALARSEALTFVAVAFAASAAAHAVPVSVTALTSGVDEMSEHFTVYFKSADGVHPVKLPATEACR